MVVALWSVKDTLGPVVAESFYKALWRGERLPDVVTLRSFYTRCKMTSPLPVAKKFTCMLRQFLHRHMFSLYAFELDVLEDEVSDRV